MSLIPIDERDGFTWYDGHLVPWDDAKLHSLTQFQYPQFWLPAHRQPERDGMSPRLAQDDGWPAGGLGLSPGDLVAAMQSWTF
jgi:hypothetical protein